MKQKRTFTLLEIMIVIFLIGLIGGIVSYSMKGSLEEGKAFKTEQAIVRIKDLLELELARGVSAAKINANVKGILEAQGVVKNVDSLMKDGWGKKLEITVSEDTGVEVTSAKLDAHKAKKTKERGYVVQEP
ncbi:MAG: prepilin-type N-terminal cleavage/methylation domain-containing protein [Verrucomicrobia bacterium]|nr:prepilin-type N-terminal cleavage/methylation domain-containing protein [Verrucomicrobiota bacterium]